MGREAYRKRTMTKTSGNTLHAGERLRELPELTASQDAQARSPSRPHVLQVFVLFGGE